LAQLVFKILVDCLEIFFQNWLLALFLFSLRLALACLFYHCFYFQPLTVLPYWAWLVRFEVVVDVVQPSVQQLIPAISLLVVIPQFLRFFFKLYRHLEVLKSFEIAPE